MSIKHERDKIMSITYKIIPRANPIDPSAAPKFYAHVITAGRHTTTEELCQEIAASSTVSETDVLAVFNELKRLIPVKIRKGEHVSLDGLFNIYPSVTGKGSEKEEDFNVAEHIDRIKVNVSVKKNLRDAVKGASLEKAYWLEGDNDDEAASASAASANGTGGNKAGKNSSKQ
jgi:predicted histone-like DNA-binding protein